MKHPPIEQLVCVRWEDGTVRFQARSPGILDAHLAEAEKICVAFGSQPPGASCKGAVFAYSFLRGQIGVGHVTDVPGGLAFHFTVLDQETYRILDGDLFRIAERFAPSWNAEGELPSLTWDGEWPARRGISEVQAVLKRSDAPTLLGACQALLDGGRLILERSSPDTEVVRALWTLLPTSTRCETWLATMIFSNALDFHISVVPRARAEDYPNHLTENQAGDYPQGSYELNLQIAAEEQDQRALDGLVARRSRAETWRLGFYILILAIGLLIVMNWVSR